LLITFAWGSSCKRVETPTPIVGPTYFPLETGKYITYSVVELNHDAFLTKTDTTSYLLRETIDSVLTDAPSGTYKLVVERSNDSGNTWEFMHFASLHKDDYSANVEKEVYADSIGLVERIFADYETQPGKYKDGKEYRKTFFESNW